MSVVVRSFERGDEAAFRAINEEWIRAYFALEQPDIDILSDPWGYVIEKGGAILMAEREGVALGTVALVPHGEGELEVAKMGVTPEARGLGIGRMLMQAAIQKGREMGARRLVLETNSKLAVAVRLYEACGFQHMSEEERYATPFSRCNVMMALRLAE